MPPQLFAAFYFLLQRFVEKIIQAKEKLHLFSSSEMLYEQMQHMSHLEWTNVLNNPYFKHYRYFLSKERWAVTGINFIICMPTIAKFLEIIAI